MTTMTAIPAWTTAGVLPPCLADPTGHDECSPYSVSLSSVVLHFDTSEARRKILAGFLDFRAKLHDLGLIEGFQWLDGSFVEDVEAIENRPPNDIDVVTFFRLPPGQTQESLLRQDQSLFDPARTKQNYAVDGYFVQLNTDAPELLVEQASYWYGLWAHRRDRLWKGFLRVDLATTDDGPVRAMLEAEAESEGEQ